MYQSAHAGPPFYSVWLFLQASLTGGDSIAGELLENAILQELCTGALLSPDEGVSSSCGKVLAYLLMQEGKKALQSVVPLQLYIEVRTLFHFVPSALIRVLLDHVTKHEENPITHCPCFAMHLMYRYNYILLSLLVIYVITITYALCVHVWVHIAMWLTLWQPLYIAMWLTLSQPLYLQLCIHRLAQPQAQSSPWQCEAWWKGKRCGLIQWRSNAF